MGNFIVEGYIVKYTKLKDCYIIEVFEPYNPVPIIWTKRNITEEQIKEIYTQKIKIMKGKA